MLSKVPQLEYVYVISLSEVVMRSAKHIFTIFLQGIIVEVTNSLNIAQPSVNPASPITRISIYSFKGSFKP